MPSSVSANESGGIIPISSRTLPGSSSIVSKSPFASSISAVSSVVAPLNSFSPSIRIASLSPGNPIGIGPGAASVIPAPSVAAVWLSVPVGLLLPDDSPLPLPTCDKTLPAAIINPSAPIPVVGRPRLTPSDDK